MSQTTSSLPSLDEPYEVTAEHRAAFERDGFVRLPGVLSADEVAAYRIAIDEAVTTVPPLRPGDADDYTYAKDFEQHMNLWRHSEGAAAFGFSPRLGRIAAELLGCEAVRMYHDQAVFKHAGGGHTPWHRDSHFFPLDTHKVVTVWMPLVDLVPEMGELRYAVGTHRRDDTPEVGISPEEDALLDGFVQRERIRYEGTGAMTAGDCTFHLADTLHMALPNRSDVVREVMTVIWFADGARVTEPINADQVNDIDRWLVGLQPGDLAAGPLNPVTYPRP
jgi:ectoine hydroxylase-related dioxygenase (phytanoyl-CoA dioxygenase family)